MIFAIFALLALGGVWLLALFPDPLLLPPSAMVNEKLTLLFLLVAGALAFVPSLHRKWSQNHDAATFFLLCVGVVLFQIADRSGPREGWAITLPFADEATAISYATRLIVVGALLSCPMWWKHSGAPERATVAGLFLVGTLGLGSLWYLSQFYQVGFDKALDPLPAATLCVQVVSYASLALCCRAATATEALRGAILRVIPVALLVMLARHQFMPIPAPVEEE
jgi:hypothetical protein